MLKKVYSSDAHIGHKNIIKYCERPWTDVEQMNTDIMKNFEEFDTPEFVHYHLGDFAFKLPQYGFKNAANSVMMYGNHDKAGQDLTSWFGTVIGHPATWRTHYAKIEDGGYTLLLSHAPLNPVTQNLPTHDFNLYGHVHNSMVLQPERMFEEHPFLKGSTKHVCVCVELIDYKPVTLEEAISINEKLWK